MTTHITKTWIEDGKLITEVFEEKYIYKREWVGLTDEEQSLLWEISRAALPRYATFCRLIEAKLKEKNSD
jgi:hypothetical protein